MKCVGGIDFTKCVVECVGGKDHSKCVVECVAVPRQDPQSVAPSGPHVGTDGFPEWPQHSAGAHQASDQRVRV